MNNHRGAGATEKGGEGFKYQHIQTGQGAE